MSEMTTFIIDAVTRTSDLFVMTIGKLDIQPSAYRFLFPATLLETIEGFKDFPRVENLGTVLLYTILLGIIRSIFQYIIFKPLAIWSMKLQYTSSDIDPKIRVVSENGRTVSIAAALPIKKEYVIVGKEKKYLSIKSKIGTFCRLNPQYTCSEIITDYKIRQNNHLVNNKVTKFVEALWRTIFYIVFFLVGCNALLLPKPMDWLLDSNKFWIGWPKHTMTKSLEFYYHVELASYIHQLMWTEVTRSDAIEMILHHVSTIILVLFSYLTNYTRVGAAILFLHDIADIFLEAAKIFNYLSKGVDSNKRAWIRSWAKTCCDILFALFAIIFFITRLVIYPKYILYSIIYETPVYFNVFEWFGYWIFAVLLIVLQFLHIFWFYLIVVMIYRLVTTGIEKDERSDDEGGSIDDLDDDTITKSATSISTSTDSNDSVRKPSSRISNRKNK